MAKPDADRMFIEQYGGSNAFMNAVNDDYCKVQFEWTCFIDGLLKDGDITQSQYDKWSFPGNRYRRNGAHA